MNSDDETATHRESATLLHLMDVGRRLVAELDPDVVLEQILAEARRITGARYAAVGVLNQTRTELARFITDGMDADAHHAIGDLPRGRGVLGVLIEVPVALRLHDVGEHPQSYGFPSLHPRMSTFLGVPIMIGDRAWGNLYLTEKGNGERFTEADESAVTILAEFAAIAIENARVYQRAERRRQELMRAVRGLEAARTISDAIGAEVALEQILELIVKRGRALIGARAVLILLADGDALVVAAGSGTTGDRRGERIPVTGTLAGRALTGGFPVRSHNLSTDPADAHDRIGIGDVLTGMMVPMIHRGEGIGILMALDRGANQEPFTDTDEELMLTFASAAANAVSISHSVEADRLKATINSAEDERRRWARELHDQTLQSLGGLRILLSSARRSDTLDSFRTAIDQAVIDLEYEIRNLRGIVADLRPPLLDDMGLVQALGALVERQRDNGLAAEVSLEFEPLTRHGWSIAPELETTLYRLAQEALTNVVKHAQATSVYVRLAVSEAGVMLLEIVDDGVGFDTTMPKSGFGLGSLRERVRLAGGLITIDSGPQGTLVHVQVPLPVARTAAAAGNLIS
jgi:signal transduction histidine kinase